jgi:carboxyl-terminal processing protease
MKNKRLPFILAMVILSFGTGYEIGTTKNIQEPVVESVQNINLNLGTYKQVWNTILERYLESETVDSAKVIDESIKGMVKSLDDPYSGYMNSDETQIFMSDLDSELEGIGAVLGMDEDLIVVETPLKGSPAEASGLKTGDLIIEVDSVSIEGQNLYEVVKKIRGPKGSKVTLGIIRKDDKTVTNLDIEITRDKITLDSVTFEEIEELFYVSINQFSDDTANEFKNAVTKALAAGSKGIILDLRFNGGGYLDSAVKILGEFLEPNSAAVQMLGKTTDLSRTINANGPGRLLDTPIVVLINQGSASASEIVAGTLQDYKKAIVVGVQSYGKGTIQDVIPFEDGSTLRLTIAKWLTAKGQDINKNGITPDLEVILSESDLSNKFDAQLDKAKQVLRNSELVSSI